MIRYQVKGVSSGLRISASGGFRNDPIFFLGNYGAGRIIKTFTLLPGEATKISIKTYTKTEAQQKSSSSILDSFTEESSQDFESSVQQEQSNKEEIFDELKGCLGGGLDGSYAEIGQRLKISEGAVKVAVHRRRERYGQQLRLQIARTVEDPDDVNEEIQHLFSALGQGT